MKNKTKFQTQNEIQSPSQNQPYLISQSNQNQKIHISTFPIWEKIYIDSKGKLKDKKEFFTNITPILIQNLLYLFPQQSKPKSNQLLYAIFNMDNESIIIKELPIYCFNPLYDESTNIIYLFCYDDSYNGDSRYNIIQYEPTKKIFNLVNQKGNAPKLRQEKFTSFILNGKIYFFGGAQLFPNDGSLGFLYTFNIKESEWKIENILNTNLSIINQGSNANEFQNFITNYFDVNICSVYSSKDNISTVYLIGGKYFDDSFYYSLSLESKIKNSKESSDIYQFNESNGKYNFNKIKYNSKFKNEYSFYSSCSYFNKKNNMIYIQNKMNLFSFNLSTNEITLLKPRLFNPIIKNNNSMIIYNNNLYLFGEFEYYDDCFIFKSNMENINIKWNFDKFITYESLLGNKECSDILCSFNTNDKNKEIYINKKILFNFSHAMKKYLSNRSNNSNVYAFNDINYITMYNLLKFIYSNFNDNLQKIDIQILDDILNLLMRYQSKGIANILISHINITSENVISFYEIGIKYNYGELIEKCKKIISSNMNIIKMNESQNMKMKLYENYFCDHKVYVKCNIVGIDIKNISQMTISNEKVNEIKDLSKDGTLNFCLNCKKVFKI